MGRKQTLGYSKGYADRWLSTGEVDAPFLRMSQKKLGMRVKDRNDAANRPREADFSSFVRLLTLTLAIRRHDRNKCTAQERVTHGGLRLFGRPDALPRPSLSGGALTSVNHAHFLKQIGRADLQRHRQALHHVHAGAITLPLKRADVSPVDAGQIRQGLLRQPASVSQSP